MVLNWQMAYKPFSRLYQCIGLYIESRACRGVTIGICSGSYLSGSRSGGKRLWLVRYLARQASQTSACRYESLVVQYALLGCTTGYVCAKHKVQGEQAIWEALHSVLCFRPLQHVVLSASQETVARHTGCKGTRMLRAHTSRQTEQI